MPLPEKETVSTEIKDFLTSNKEADPEKGLQAFSDFLADLILRLIKEGDITGVTATVTGTSASGGPVTGSATQDNIAKIS